MPERKTSPLAFTRSSSARFSSSEPSRRKHTTENGRGAQSSQPGSSRTQPSKRSASAIPRRITSCNPSRPWQRSTVHSFRARKPRPSSTPYSLKLTTSSVVRRYSGTTLNAARKSSGRRVQNAEHPCIVSSHLCGLTTSESTPSIPSNAQRSSGQTIADPA